MRQSSQPASLFLCSAAAMACSLVNSGMPASVPAFFFPCWEGRRKQSINFFICDVAALRRATDGVAGCLPAGCAILAILGSATGWMQSVRPCVRAAASRLITQQAQRNVAPLRWAGLGSGPLRFLPVKMKNKLREGRKREGERGGGKQASKASKCAVIGEAEQRRDRQTQSQTDRQTDRQADTNTTRTQKFDRKRRST